MYCCGKAEKDWSFQRRRGKLSLASLDFISNRKQRNKGPSWKDSLGILGKKILIKKIKFGDLYFLSFAFRKAGSGFNNTKGLRLCSTQKKDVSLISSL